MSASSLRVFAAAIVSFCLLTGPAGATPVASSTSDQSPAEVRDYWTNDRMEDAIPLDVRPSEALPGAGSLREPGDGAQRSFSVPATGGGADYSATTVTNTTAPGIRTHGKIFASNAFFDYVCSGTVVTSQNRSTVWTAAHCIYDTDSEVFADNVLFVPGYNDAARPFGTWAARTVFAPTSWVDFGNNIDDVGAAAMQVKKRSKTAAEKRRCNRFSGAKKRRCKRKKVNETIQAAVGSRGIAFNQDPEDFTYNAYGYPVNPQPRFDGQHMELCISPFTVADMAMGPPNPIGIDCDMQGGSSGGGWVIAGGRVNGNVSYGYPGIDPDTFYSPYYDTFLKGFYDAIKNQ